MYSGGHIQISLDFIAISSYTVFSFNIKVMDF